MRRRSFPLQILAGVLAAATALLAASALAALNGGGAFTLGGVRVMEIAAGYDAAADAILASPRRKAGDLARAATLSRKAIALNPYDSSAWLRLASIDVLEHGRLTEAGVASIRRSYDLVAFDPYVASWRIRFALEHWQDVPADLRAEVRAEAMALGGEWRHRNKMLPMLRDIRNPAARLTANLWAARIERTVPK